MQPWRMIVFDTRQVRALSALFSIGKRDLNGSVSRTKKFNLRCFSLQKNKGRTQSSPFEDI